MHLTSLILISFKMFKVYKKLKIFLKMVLISKYICREIAVYLINKQKLDKKRGNWKAIENRDKLMLIQNI